MTTVTVQPTKPYPTVGDVLQLARVIVNDAFGPNGVDGDLLSSSQPYTPVLLKSAWEQLQDELADAGVDSLVKEIIIPNFPAVYTTDPAVTVYIDWDGSWDGQTIYPVGDGNPALPYDLVITKSVWERPHGSGTSFTEVVPWDGGLPGGFQSERLRWYEWRNDKLWFKGATQAIDLKVSYLAYLPDLEYDNNAYEVPIMRSLRAMSYIVASEYARPRGAAVADNLYAMAEAEIAKIANRTARRKAVITYRRKPFGCN